MRSNDIDYSISFSFSFETNKMLELGKEINRKHHYAYMNMHNWTTLFHYYISSVDSSFPLSDLHVYPEHGDYMLEMPYDQESLGIMKKLEQHLMTMLSDKQSFLNFINNNSNTCLLYTSPSPRD